MVGVWYVFGRRKTKTVKMSSTYNGNTKECGKRTQLRVKVVPANSNSESERGESSESKTTSVLPAPVLTDIPDDLTVNEAVPAHSGCESEQGEASESKSNSLVPRLSDMPRGGDGQTVESSAAAREIEHASLRRTTRDAPPQTIETNLDSIENDISR